jgi:hypothetical protein
VGVVGTFDVENYGDLLFPLIAQKELAARPRSPAGAAPLHRQEQLRLWAPRRQGRHRAPRTAARRRSNRHPWCRLDANGLTGPYIFLQGVRGLDGCCRFPPLVGNSSVLVRSDRSWHAVQPFVEGSRKSRRSVTVTFYRPGAPSTMWPSGDTTPLHTYDPAGLDED